MSANAPLLTDASRLSAQQNVENYAEGVAIHINSDWARHYQLRIVDKNWVDTCGDTVVGSSRLRIPVTFPDDEQDSGVDTAVLASGTVTLSTTNYLSGTATDVGRFIKLKTSGQTYRITAAISTTQCTVTPADSVAADVFTIYYSYYVVIPVVPFVTATAAGIPPSITGQPQATSCGAGESAQFFVAAAGSAMLTYQWFRDGTGLTGATSPQLAITNATVGQSGNYTCLVSNAYGQAMSAAATLTVRYNFIAYKDESFWDDVGDFFGF
jgi:hypothetical protein